MARIGGYKGVAQGSFIVVTEQFFILFFGGSCVDPHVWQSIMELYIKTTKKWVHAMLLKTEWHL